MKIVAIPLFRLERRLVPLRDVDFQPWEIMYAGRIVGYCHPGGAVIVRLAPATYHSYRLANWVGGMIAERLTFHVLLYERYVVNSINLPLRSTLPHDERYGGS